MIRYVLVSIVGGILFGAMDGLINANPVAQKLFEVYKPIARTSLNVPAGMIIDLVYGFALAGIYLLLFKSLPGETPLLKGLSFALMAWFFRVAMSAAAQWMMINIPKATLFYMLVTGLAEMLILGLLYGLTLKPILKAP